MKVSEEPCQCPDCRRFYKEHDRLIRQFPTLRQQQEINWAALQSFRTLCGKVLEDLQKKLNVNSLSQYEEDCQTGTAEKKEKSITQVITDLENINAHLYSIEALMERIFDVKVPDEVEDKFREVAGELAPDPLNIDRLKLNRLLHQTPDLPDK
tara:strand:+ start:350 stop:808 length:459 start_codon:yes stop_codon:yes gene_type:complete